MSYDIFISYSTQDRLFVDALAHDLEEAGIRCWYAPRNITAGMTWPEAIAKAIQEIPAMLLVFSSSSNNSEEVSRELTLAASNKCLVIPVRIENVAPSAGMNYYLLNRHWLDVYDMETRASIERVLEGLRRYPGLFFSKKDQRPDEPAPVETAKAAPTAAPASTGGRKFPPGKPAAWAAALLLILLGVFLWQGTRDRHPDKEAQLLRPNLESSLFVYTDDYEDPSIQLLIMPLEPMGDQPETYLAVFFIQDDPYSGQIFRCETMQRPPDDRTLYMTKQGDKQHLLVNMTPYGRSLLFSPGNEESPYRAFFSHRRDRPALANALLDVYRSGDKIEQSALETILIRKTR
ncbi:MAG: toll/interleukin-1 receptor domain-containing protein [Desulfovibrionaceae bacterium]|nr:toll/interleukin-1 receptor domain-containing protein [Desulfovibrionaceae bacterium]